MPKRSKSKSKSTSNTKKKRAPRSLRIASRRAFSLVHKALDRKGWKQYALLSEVEVGISLSESTLDSFFAGIGIERKTFVAICKALDLPPEEICEPEQIIEVPRGAVPYYSGEQRLKQMDELVEQQGKNNGIVISIPDMGGQGKTEFVLKFIEEKVAKDKTRFSGGCVFIDVNQNIFQQVNRFFHRVATQNPTVPEWKKPPSNPKDQRKAVQDWYDQYQTKYPTKPFPVLLVFDDVQELEQLEGYLPKTYHDHFGVLITTRKQILALSYDVFYIEPFTEEDSIDLFSEIIKPKWIISELREEFTELAFLVGYLPLAIEIESKLIKTRMVGRRVVDKPDFIPDTKRKLQDLIETLKQPCEIPPFLKSISEGLGLTTELNTDKARRKELKENGIVALFLYTWNLFTQEVAQIAYAASLFEVAPVNIGCLNNWLSSSLKRSVEDIVFKDLAEYSFCKVNNYDEIEIHKLIRKFILERRSDIENVQEVEKSIAISLRDSIGTYSEEYTEVAHFTDVSAIWLEEYFCKYNSNIDPWQYVSGYERLVETALITRISRASNDIDDVVKKAHILSEIILSRIEKLNDVEHAVCSLVDLNILYSRIGLFEQSIEVLERADTLLSSSEEKELDELRANVHREIGLAVKLDATVNYKRSKSYSLRGMSDAVSGFHKAYYEFFRAIDLLTENDEKYWMLHNDVAGLFLSANRFEEALVFAEDAYNGIHELKKQGADAIFSDIQVLGLVYLYFDRLADARRIFREYINEKEDPLRGVTKVERVLIVGGTFFMATMQTKKVTKIRKYLLMTRRYLTIGIREHKKSMGEQSDLYLRSISRLEEVNKRILIADKQIKKNQKRKAISEKARK